MADNGQRFGELDGDLSDAEEIQAANLLAEQIDHWLAGQPVDSTDPRLAVAERLVRLSDSLPPPKPAFERRVLGRLGQSAGHRRAFPTVRLPLRALWPAAASAVVIIALLLTVPGQTALARLAAIFQLDTVKVGINVATETPSDARPIVAPRIERSLDTLEMVQHVAPVPIQVPRNLPAGWSLTDARAVYYPDLPANVPLNVVLSYERDSGGSLKIIEYFVQLGDNLTVDSLSRIDGTSTSAHEIMIGGRRAILVESTGIQDARTLIWQQDGVLLEIETREVAMEDLLSIATSMHPME